MAMSYRVTAALASSPFHLGTSFCGITDAEELLENAKSIAGWLGLLDITSAGP
jgi:hypothetical protein